MKTYHQFITEIRLLPKLFKRHTLGLRTQTYGLGSYFKQIVKQQHTQELLHVDKLKSGHKIYHHVKTHLPSEKIYRVVNKHSGKISTVLVTTPNSGGVETIDRVATTRSMRKNKNRLKLVDLYHHLITKHNVILATDDQSVGGMKTWQELSRKKGINIHGWDKETGKPINTPSILTPDNAHETHYKDIGMNDFVTPETKRTRLKVKHKNPEYVDQIRDIRHRDHLDAYDDVTDNRFHIGRMRLVAHKKD